MDQSHSSAADRFLVSPENPGSVWNRKVHHHVNKCPPPVSILSQINPVRAPHPTS